MLGRLHFIRQYWIRLDKHRKNFVEVIRNSEKKINIEGFELKIPRGHTAARVEEFARDNPRVCSTIREMSLPVFSALLDCNQTSRCN